MQTIYQKMETTELDAAIEAGFDFDALLEIAKG